MKSNERKGRVWGIFPCTITENAFGGLKVELTDSVINLWAFEAYTAVLYLCFEIKWAILSSFTLDPNYEYPEFLFRVTISDSKKDT